MAVARPLPYGKGRGVNLCACARQDTKEWAFQASTPDNDPLNEESWPRELREAIWAKFTAWTGVDWDDALRSKCGKL